MKLVNEHDTRSSATRAIRSATRSGGARHAGPGADPDGHHLMVGAPVLAPRRAEPATRPPGGRWTATSSRGGAPAWPGCDKAARCPGCPSRCRSSDVFAGIGRAAGAVWCRSGWPIDLRNAAGAGVHRLRRKPARRGHRPGSSGLTTSCGR